MKQKKGKEKSEDMIITLEKRIKEAIQTTPGIAQIPKKAYYDIVQEALENVIDDLLIELSET